MVEAIRRNRDPGQLIGVVFIGMRKAFYTFNHSALSESCPIWELLVLSATGFTEIEHGCKVSRYRV